jgi:hypothetical protein
VPVERHWRSTALVQKRGQWRRPSLVLMLLVRGRAEEFTGLMREPWRSGLLPRRSGTPRRWTTRWPLFS